MNKCKTPKVPPILVNNLFILNCKDKARYFNDFFSQQCEPMINSSILPSLNFLTDERINHTTIHPMEYLVKCKFYVISL